jgi:gamma-glutamylcyclotransferase (GGCT)/AIG2-like uncharacterized protein YtfP
MHPLFVYGTLKRGGSNHGFIAGQRFVADARTVAGFRLYELDGYPGMVADPADTDGVTGELWAVDERCLRALDEFEGVHEGLYRRAPVALAGLAESATAETYLYARSIAGRKRLGSTWMQP